MEDISPEVTNLLLEIARSDNNSFMLDKRDLDFKASIILAGSGVLLGLIINGLGKLNHICALISSLFLVSSAMLCVLLLIMRKYDTLCVKEAYQYFKENKLLYEYKSAKQATWLSLGKFTEKNRTTYDKISKYMDYAIPLFFGGILFLTISFFI